MTVELIIAMTGAICTVLVAIGTLVVQLRTKAVVAEVKKDVNSTALALADEKKKKDADLILLNAKHAAETAALNTGHAAEVATMNAKALADAKELASLRERVASSVPGGSVTVAAAPHPPAPPAKTEAPLAKATEKLAAATGELADATAATASAAATEAGGKK